MNGLNCRADHAFRYVDRAQISLRTAQTPFSALNVAHHSVKSKVSQQIPKHPLNAPSRKNIDSMAPNQVSARCGINLRKNNRPTDAPWDHEAPRCLERGIH